MSLVAQRTFSFTINLATEPQVCGTILAIAFSSKQGAEIGSVTDLLDLWNNPAWIVYIFIVMGLAVALHVRTRACILFHQNVCLRCLRGIVRLSASRYLIANRRPSEIISQASFKYSRVTWIRMFESPII